ncbi:MAG: alpha amylase C-terminal domain-containing protein, partial [Oscillospiraceae bacterium]|nr:alpha amylase C-terminal domain-containing protein [Oscillospiraceae bacterium]
RVDAVSSMLYLNYGRKDGEYTPNRDGGNINLAAVEFLRKLNTAVLSEYPGAITIAEESTAYPMVTMPPSLGGLGFSFKWDMGYMHDTLDYFSTDPLFRSGKHDKLTFSMMYAFSENFILAYSHDEVVHGKKSMLDKMFGSYEQKFATLRSLYGYQFAHPGKKLCFMGSEFGQFIEWNYEQELDWLLLDYPMHEKLRLYYKELNRLYTSCPALYECDKSWDGFKWLNVDDKSLSSIAFLRSAKPKSDSYLICACNFIPNEHRGFVIGLPQKGVLREVLSSDDVRFGGNGLHNADMIQSRKAPFNDFSYSASIDLPPLSAVYFEFIPERMTEKDEERIQSDT